MIRNTERMECKYVFFKTFPKDVINHIFEYHVTYKEIMDGILKNDIKVPQPDLFDYNNWNGPQLLFAYIRDGPTIVCDITKFIQNLYGKKRNWNRRAQILKFNPDYVGYYLELVFDIYHIYNISTQITDLLHINPRELMSPTLQYCLAIGVHPERIESFFFHGYFTDKAYSIILREIERYKIDY